MLRALIRELNVDVVAVGVAVLTDARCVRRMRVRDGLVRNQLPVVDVSQLAARVRVPDQNRMRDDAPAEEETQDNRGDGASAGQNSPVVYHGACPIVTGRTEPLRARYG
jgi:hypothetical protein